MFHAWRHASQEISRCHVDLMAIIGHRHLDGGKVSEYLVRCRELPDAILIFNDLSKEAFRKITITLISISIRMQAKRGRDKEIIDKTREKPKGT